MEEVLTVKDLKRMLSEIPDDVEVLYERIDDFYFEDNGWEPILLEDDKMNSLIQMGFEQLDENDDETETCEYINIMGATYNKKEGYVKLTAHF